MTKSFAVFLQEAGRPKGNAKYDLDKMRADAEKLADKPAELKKLLAQYKSIRNAGVYELAKELSTKHNISHTGRPKKDVEKPDEDDEKTEGKRTYIMVATINVDGKRKMERSAPLKGISFEAAKKAAAKWEKELNAKYNFDADIDIEIENSDGETVTGKVDPHGREDVDSHSIAR